MSSIGVSRTGLTLYAYTLPTNGGVVTRAYRSEVDRLTFSHIAPGGFGTLTARIALPNAQLPQPQLALGARVALMSRGVGPQNNGNPYCRFLGEIWDRRPGMDARGFYLQITALGIGNWMRDDPRNYTYSNQTPLQMISNQLSTRSGWTPIATDTSGIFPDNPGATYSTYYPRRTMEEVCQDVCTLAGDYMWGTWAHQMQTDAAGFPKGQLFIHKRDTSTTRYSASVKQGDVESYEGAENGDRAYNHIEVDYSTSTGVATATYSDPRLSGTSQNNAPFRYRSLVRDLTGNAAVGSSQASGIASTYGAQMKDPTPKMVITLRRVRDAAGNLIPLDAVQADATISIPEMAVRGLTGLATAPTAGINQFYIYRSTYSQDNQGNQSLMLETDNYADRAETVMARLQARADAVSRNGNTLQNAAIQAQGLPLTVKWAFSMSNVTASDSVGPVITYPLRLFQPATSHTFVGSAGSVGVSSGPFSNDYTIYGANAWVVSSGGHTFWSGNATTAGNCLYEIHHEQGRVSWHCDGCDTLHHGLAIAEHVMVSAPYGDAPGLAGLAIRCPLCGAVESFNTGLFAHEEDEERPGNYARRAEQTRLIRRLQQHPLVGLRAHP